MPDGATLPAVVCGTWDGRFFGGNETGPSMYDKLMERWWGSCLIGLLGALVTFQMYGDLAKLEAGQTQSVRLWAPIAFLYNTLGMWGALAPIALFSAGLLGWGIYLLAAGKKQASGPSATCGTEESRAPAAPAMAPISDRKHARRNVVKGWYYWVWAALALAGLWGWYFLEHTSNWRLSSHHGGETDTAPVSFVFIMVASWVAALVIFFLWRRAAGIAEHGVPVMAGVQYTQGAIHGMTNLVVEYEFKGAKHTGTVSVSTALTDKLSTGDLVPIIVDKYDSRRFILDEEGLAASQKDGRRPAKSCNWKPIVDMPVTMTMRVVGFAMLFAAFVFIGPIGPLGWGENVTPAAVTIFGVMAAGFVVMYFWMCLPQARVVRVSEEPRAVSGWSRKMVFFLEYASYAGEDTAEGLDWRLTARRLKPDWFNLALCVALLAVFAWSFFHALDERHKEQDWMRQQEQQFERDRQEQERLSHSPEVQNGIRLMNEAVKWRQQQQQKGAPAPGTPSGQ